MLSAATLAVPASICEVSFLGYSSQFLFPYLEPGPLTHFETALFNILILSVLVGYYRTCTTDAGCIPKDLNSSPVLQDGERSQRLANSRWCRRCEAYKPPRAHHCKVCKRYSLFKTAILLGKTAKLTCLLLLRCIPKMDHHVSFSKNTIKIAGRH